MPLTEKTTDPGGEKTRLKAARSESGVLARKILRSIWENGCSAPLVTSRRHDARVGAVAFSCGDASVVSCDGSGTVQFWDPVGLKRVGRPVAALGQAMALSPRHEILAVGDAERSGTIELWCLDKWQPIGSISAGTVQALAFSPDGEVLAARKSDDCRVHLYSIRTVKCFQVLGKKSDGGSASPGKALVAFSPDGKIIATTSRDRTSIIFFDVVSGEQVGAPLSGGTIHCDNWLESLFFKNQAMRFEDFRYSPDGHIIATCGNDRTVRLWSTEDGQQIGEHLVGHRKRVNSVAFSPDGRVLASCANDRQVLLWDVDRHKLIGTPLVGHSKPVTTVAFSSDNRVLATGSKDRTVKLWIAPATTSVQAPSAGQAGGHRP